MAEAPLAEYKKLSILDNISKAAAVFGALIAVGQAGTSWVNGYWQAQAERERAQKERDLAEINAGLLRDVRLDLVCRYSLVPEIGVESTQDREPLRVVVDDLANGVEHVSAFGIHVS